jgi:hypothetical protein
MITWITPAGSLGILTERVLQDIALSATSTVGDITFEVISGSLPRGIRLINGHLVGSPVEVKKWTVYRFVIRANDGIDLEDRTFSLSIDGADIPQWVTKEGYLNVGSGDAYFVLDNSYVNFQLSVYDTDLTAGDILEYYLVPMGGELPPGLSLSSTGVISGFTDPVFAVEYNGNPDGSYDTSSYDTMPLDVVRTNSNGFDTYFYDNVIYDYSDNSRTPRRLSRSYTFAVAVTDGANTINRIFKIYVVTEEFLQADNNILQVDTNLFQADASRDRVPLWITESYLGRLRANNYITLFLDVYDPPSLEGTITYFLLNTNPGSYKLASTGEVITTGRYEISGKFPQFKYVITGTWSSTKNYLVGDLVEYADDSGLAVFWVCQNPHINRRPGTGNFWNRKIYTTTGTFIPENPSSWLVVYPETASVVPPGMELDSITGEIAGRVPYQAAVTKNYKFSLLAVNFPNTLSNQAYNLIGDWSSVTYYHIYDAVRYDGFIYICIKANSGQVVSNTEYWLLGVSSSEKTFSLDLIGEIESSIEWLTDSDLGSIKPNQPSYISIAAKSLLYGGRVSYDLISGELPPGLTFLPTGDIQGKVKQFADNNGVGLTRFFNIQIAPPNPPGFDGQNHNPLAPLRNSVGSAVTRYGPARYTDGMHSMGFFDINPRLISNVVVAGHGTDADPNGYSGMLYAWGQFLTHDLDFIRPGIGNIGITVPDNDTALTPGSIIPVTRSAVAPGTGINSIPAAAINDVTGWIDASVVYGVAYPPGVPQGPTPFANPVEIREGGVTPTGKLLTTSDGLYGPIVDGMYMFGDPRGTENPDLTAIQTLFVRDHNWHVDRLTSLSPGVDGEHLYQRARSLVIAEMQKITYDEWLPKIIGENALPPYVGFDPLVDASIKIEFNAAALRFGHSIVSNALDRIDEQGTVTESLLLRDAFFLTPNEFERNGGADGFIRKLAADVSNKLDVHIVDDLRNLLDDPPAAMDLAATNIQRGRDLGIPTLNQMRTRLGLTPYSTFDQITSNAETATALRTAYGSVGVIDLWVGGLAENPVPGAMVGETFRTILIDHFTRLRDGDSFWWENKQWSPEDRALLDNTTLAGLILRNTNTIKIQNDVFTAVERADLYNGLVPSATPIVVPNIPPAAFNTTFDGGVTTFDKRFSFTVKARDSVNFAEVTKTFYINVTADNTKTFANLYVKAFQPKTKRLTWYDFITDANIFKSNEMYRYGDPNFGIQTDLKMLVFAGIESTEAVKYVQAMSRNHYRKRLLFGNVQYAKARDPVTQEIIYEVVYVQLIDSSEKNGVSISNTIELPDNIKSPVLISYDAIKIDSDIPLVSDRDHQRVFPNSIKNMRKRIQGVGDRDREFLPLWMRSIQDQADRETGFVKALTLCYTKPGTSEGIIARIKANGFDFKTIDFVADRYLIDILDGEIEDKYLAFPQRGEKLP